MSIKQNVLILVMILLMILGISLMYFSGDAVDSQIEPYTFEVDFYATGNMSHNLFGGYYDFDKKEGEFSFYIPKENALKGVILTFPFNITKENIQIFTRKCNDLFNERKCNNKTNEKINAEIIVFKEYKTIKSVILIKNFSQILSGKMFKLKFNGELSPYGYYTFLRWDKDTDPQGFDGYIDLILPKDYHCLENCFRSLAGSDQQIISNTKSRIHLKSDVGLYQNSFLINPAYERKIFERVDYENLFLGFGISIFSSALIIIITELFLINKKNNNEM